MAIEDHAAALTDCSDAIQLVQRFRDRGVGRSELFSAVPELQKLVRANSFQTYMDFKVAAEVEAATLIIFNNQFVVDVTIQAAESMEKSISAISLEQDETGSPWAHVPLETLKAELLSCLRERDVSGFIRRLTSLSQSQELATLFEAGSVALEQHWSDAAAALERAIGSPAIRCCEGLRATYYNPPGREVFSPPSPHKKSCMKLCRNVHVLHSCIRLNLD